jgi:hypothetical protein
MVTAAWRVGTDEFDQIRRKMPESGEANMQVDVTNPRSSIDRNVTTGDRLRMAALIPRITTAATYAHGTDTMAYFGGWRELETCKWSLLNRCLLSVFVLMPAATVTAPKTAARHLMTKRVPGKCLQIDHLGTGAKKVESQQHDACSETTALPGRHRAGLQR